MKQVEPILIINLKNFHSVTVCLETPTRDCLLHIYSATQDGDRSVTYEHISRTVHSNPITRFIDALNSAYLILTDFIFDIVLVLVTTVVI